MARRARHKPNAAESSSTRTSALLVDEPTPWLVVSSVPRVVPPPPAPESRLRRSSSTATSADDAEPVEEEGASRSLESFPTSFISWDELDVYIREFGESTFQLFRKRTTVSVAKRNQDITKRVQERKALRNFKQPELIPAAWEFYCKTFVCTHGLKNYPRGDGRRTHTSVRDTGCMARIHATLKLDKSSGAYGISTRVSGAHNHTIDRERYLSYAENRKITDPELLRDIADMSARGELPKTILAHITQRMREMTGRQLHAMDLLCVFGF
uniref:FAR1 domain-containing protein n=1 Tax=Globisporangium ultimum (strain ATCC 200006 / CBS 805.95 / DAOM BR144) TaxID=431595 RepID=K3WY65_GLOUD